MPALVFAASLTSEFSGMGKSGSKGLGSKSSLLCDDMMEGVVHDWRIGVALQANRKAERD